MSKNKLLIKLAAAGLLFLALGIWYYCFVYQNKGTVSVEPVLEASGDVLVEQEKDGEEAFQEQEVHVPAIMIYICGAVEKPGVYELLEGDRLSDAINAAGGASSDAALDYMNLAKKLCDEQRIYVPTVQEAEEGRTDFGLLYEDVQEGSSKAQEDGKININHASEKELMELPGIGVSRAGAIISYREENGAFQSIEDLQKISGIKGSVFEKIKELVTAGK